MTCRYCDALAYNRAKAPTEPRNAVVRTSGGRLYVAPVPSSEVSFERVIKGSMNVARLTARSAPHAAATVIPTECPGCGVPLEGVLLECASYGAEVATFLPDLRPLADASKPAGVVLFTPHWEGEKRLQLVVWSHPKLGEGIAMAVDGAKGLGPWEKLPGAVAGGFWLAWDAKKMWRGLAKSVQWGTL